MDDPVRQKAQCGWQHRSASLYVSSSLEVFAKGYTVAGANQIFPAPNSLTASVFVEGGAAKADIALYPLRHLERQAGSDQTTGTGAGFSCNKLIFMSGDTLDLKAYVMPASVSLKRSAGVDQPDLVSVTEDGNKLPVTKGWSGNGNL